MEQKSKITTANIGAAGVTIDTAPGTTQVSSGLTAIVGGQSATGTSSGSSSESSSSGGGDREVIGVNVSPVILDLTVGKDATLTAIFNPTNATNKAVPWSSDNKAIATVNNTGVVTAVGTATITVTTADGGKTATCAVTVIAAAQSGANDITAFSFTSQTGAATINTRSILWQLK